MSFQTIKSVRRVFEILELFAAEQRPLAAKEVAKRLGYPLMSAHALLKSIHAMGYVDFDSPSWTYLPSRNLVAILEWVPDILEREKALLDLVAELNQATGETINISRRTGTKVRFLHGLENRHTVGVSVKIGATMPVNRSLTGIVSLCLLGQQERIALLQRSAAEMADASPGPDHEEIDAILAELEASGIVTRCDLLVEGIGAVCVPVRAKTSDDLLVVGVAGPSHRIETNRADYEQTVRTLLSKHAIATIYPVR